MRPVLLSNATRASVPRGLSSTNPSSTASRPAQPDYPVTTPPLTYPTRSYLIPNLDPSTALIHSHHESRQSPLLVESQVARPRGTPTHPSSKSPLLQSRVLESSTYPLSCIQKPLAPCQREGLEIHSSPGLGRGE